MDSTLDQRCRQLTAVETTRYEAISAPATSHFSSRVALPEGNYNVTVTLGDQSAATNTTIKAESRRLMLEKVATEAGKFATRTFTVNIHTPKIIFRWRSQIKTPRKRPAACICIGTTSSHWNLTARAHVFVRWKLPRSMMPLPFIWRATPR